MTSDTGTDHCTGDSERSEGSDEEEMSIATADAMVPKTWDEICGMTEEDSLRL